MIKTLLTITIFGIFFQGCSLFKKPLPEKITFKISHLEIESTPDSWIYKRSPKETPFFGVGSIKERRESLAGVYSFKEFSKTAQGLVKIYSYTTKDNVSKSIFGSFKVYQCDDNSTNTTGVVKETFSKNGLLDGEKFVIHNKCLFIKRSELNIED